jgi:hypothetical protein
VNGHLKLIAGVGEIRKERLAKARAIGGRDNHALRIYQHDLVEEGK